MSAGFELDRLSFRYGRREVLRGLSAAFGAAEFTAVAGPNGAGKSTLISVMAGAREDYGGSCRFDGREDPAWRKRDFAKRIAYIPQTVAVEFPFSCEEVVYMGRTPHCRGLFETEDDRRAVARALRLADAEAFAPRPFKELSGGERQRVVLASALAQEPAVLLLDEPTTFLDLKHQVAIYGLLRRLARESGAAVIAVTHDLNLAAAYADRVLLLADGEIRADGHPAAVVTEELIRDVFETAVRIQQGPGGRPWMSYA